MITLRGHFTVDVRNVLFVVNPNLTIEKVPIVSAVFPRIREGEKVLKRVRLLDAGVYLISVSHVSGEAVINRPIYVGEGYPLLPDFEDLKMNKKKDKDKK